MGIDFIQIHATGDYFASVEKDFFDWSELPGFESLGEDVDLLFGDVLVNIFFTDFCRCEETGNDASGGFLLDEWPYLATRSFVFELSEAGLNLFEVEVRYEIDFEFGGFSLPMVADFARDAEYTGAS